MDLLSPSSAFERGALHFPMTCVPDQKISLSRLFRILRDQEHMGEFRDDDGSMREIRIGSERIIHSDVVQLRRDMPVDIGAVMWSALSIPTAGIYLPFYFGVKDVPPAYGAGLQDDGAAHFVYKDLHRALQSGNGKGTVGELRALETSLLENQTQFEASMLALFARDKDAAREALTESTHDISTQALAKATAACAAKRIPRT
jgi:dipeptidase